MTKTIKLLPCLHCEFDSDKMSDPDPQYKDPSRTYCIECEKCGMRTKNCLTPSQAAQLWNHRPKQLPGEKEMIMRMIKCLKYISEGQYTSGVKLRKMAHETLKDVELIMDMNNRKEKYD